MFFVALATDYDGTLALHGKVDAATCAALEEVRQSGRKLILVTGRDLPDLQRVFDRLDLFDLVVAENGALLFDPARKEEVTLCDPPSPLLVARLKDSNVSPLVVGRAIIATWEPNETIVLQAIRDLGLEQHIIFNKGAVMVLPSDVNKASGLKCALERLKLSAHNVVGIGDAENDQAFLGSCGRAVAVDNALPTVKERADFIVADHGAGVIELARLLVDDDLAQAPRRASRKDATLGTAPDGAPVAVSPFETVLVAGSSGAGKSTVVTALLEQMRELGFQFCVIDPEGDYAEMRDTVVIGDGKQLPRIPEVMDLLDKPGNSVVVNLLALDPHDRPAFLAKLLPELSKLRVETGRPHWIVIDEVHHCLPAKWDPAPIALPRELPAVVAVTVHPEQVAPDFLALVSSVVGVGDGARQAIEKFCSATGQRAPALPGGLQKGHLLLRRADGSVQVLKASAPKEKQQRHIRKYAEGELGEDKSFYFRGPDGKLNLRAQNLGIFLQLAAGVDDETWLHHLRQGGYSQWLAEAIKDDELADEVSLIETDASLSAKDSRERVKELIERRYTAPAKAG